MNKRTSLMLKLLKRSSKATFTIPADLIDDTLMDSNIKDELNDAINELSYDTDLNVTNTKIEDEYTVTVEIKVDKVEPIEEEINTTEPEENTTEPTPEITITTN